MAMRCKESFAIWIGGVPRVVSAGEVVANNDPVVSGRPSAFEDVEAAFARDALKVEQATAAPGELRTVSPAPVKRAPAKKAAGS